MLGHKVSLYFIFQRRPDCFPKQLCVLGFHQPCVRVLVSPRLHQHLLLSTLNAHPSGYEALSHCGFYWLCPGNWWSQTSFHMRMGRLHIFFEVMSIQIICPYFSGVISLFWLSCKILMYIPDTSSLSDIRLANIFCLWLISFSEISLTKLI